MKKLLVVVIILVGVSVLSYALLGGFKSLEVQVQTNPETLILGIAYSGKINSDSLQNLFMEARDIVENSPEASAIAIAYYGEANEETGMVNNFIGVELSANKTDLTHKDWKIRRFNAQNSVTGCISANILVMPTPEDMLTELRTFSKEQQLQSDTVFIEYYKGPNDLCVELLAK